MKRGPHKGTPALDAAIITAVRQGTSPKEAAANLNTYPQRVYQVMRRAGYRPYYVTAQEARQLALSPIKS
jgi:hypothetical protein